RHVAGLGRARRALSITADQVQSAISKQAALIEFLGYWHYLGTNKWEARYGAAILASSGEPKWVCLGSATNIEASIKACLQSVRGHADEKQLAAALRTLYQQLWSPIEAILPAGTKTVIISPDARLNFISFATLLAPDGQ